jgi:hypothetical protein
MVMKLKANYLGAQQLALLNTGVAKSLVWEQIASPGLSFSLPTSFPPLVSKGIYFTLSN